MAACRSSPHLLSSMADTTAWSHSAGRLGGHYSSAGAHRSAAFYQPPVFSSSLPSYTLTQTFTFPSYLNTSHTLTSSSPAHTQSASQQLYTSQRQSQSPPPSVPHDSTASTTSIFHSPVLSSPHAAAAASPSLLSTVSSLSSSLPSPSFVPAPSVLSSSDSSSASPPSVRSRLSSSERKARRAAKHRAIDLTRRTRESAALVHLKQLLAHSATSSHNHTATPSEAVLTAASSPSLSTISATDSKAAVLEQTVAEMLRLRALVATQQQAISSGQTAPLHRPLLPPLPHALSPDWPALYNHHTTHHSPPHTPSSSPLTPHAPPAASTLTSLSSDLHTLYSSFFLHSPHHLTLIQPGTAACIDSNHSFLVHARLARSEVVGKRITLCPAVRLLLDRGERIVPEEFMGGRGVDCGRERQAANGLSLVRLYSGSEESVLCRFRYVLGNGRVVDVRGRCWLTKGRFSGVVGDAPLMIVQSGEEDYNNVAA